MSTLTAALPAQARPAELSVRMSNDRVRCLACGHRCVVYPGLPGICKVRFNRAGVLYAPWGHVAGTAVDPIEKKPFFHVLPGSSAFSFGMLGCNFHCSYCQNWITSQSARDPAASTRTASADPEMLAAAARESGARAIVSTYNEPLITAEWSIDVFRAARKAGLLTGFVSNGYASGESLAALLPWLDLFKVDLKTFRDREYRKLGGKLAVVTDSIRTIHALGFWLEVVTLIVPGINDSAEELRDIAAFLASVSPSIPWHVTAFHPDYKMLGRPPTTADSLLRAVEIGRAAGLEFVYAGNLPGRVGSAEDTLCPGCGLVLVERSGYRIKANRIASGACPRCTRMIPGVWTPRRAPLAVAWRDANQAAQIRA
jgi:pyruvate formate lyase activating enzyme